MTTLWFQRKTGRAIGASRFIQRPRRVHVPLVRDRRLAPVEEPPAAGSRQLAVGLCLDQDGPLDAA